MTKGKCEIYKKRLLEIRDQLAGDVDKAMKHSNEEVSGEVPDINDDATRTYSRQVILHIGEKEREQLREVEKSLIRIENNEYGDCGICGKEIPAKRLELLPYAKYCVSCKEIAEG